MENNKEQALVSLSMAKKELKNAASLLFAMHLDEVASNEEGNKSYETITEMLGELAYFIDNF